MGDKGGQNDNNRKVLPENDNIYDSSLSDEDVQEVKRTKLNEEEQELDMDKIEELLNSKSEGFLQGILKFFKGDGAVEQKDNCKI